MPGNLGNNRFDVRQIGSACIALRRPNVLPTGDLGVRAAIQKAYDLAEMPKPAEMERIAAAWRPYCSVASWYLWRSLDIQEAV